jgi:CheY-like chemotaxis protein
VFEVPVTKTLLIADDEPHLLETTRFILEAEGYRVLTARDGLEALQIIKRERPPVVLLDVMMPNMDGYEVCREIRRDPNLAGTYVMILTAMGRRSEEEDALAAGANTYLRKPLAENLILEKLEAAFTAHGA